MPARKRLWIWSTRLLAVLLLALGYIWVFQHTGHCTSDLGVQITCTPQDAWLAIGHGFKQAGPTLFIVGALVVATIVPFVGMMWLLARGRTYVVFPGEYDVGFDDVLGLDPVVGSVKQVVKLFRGFREFKKLGGYPPHGILFEGPPGTGKTLLGKAMAGTVGVPFIYCSATSFSNMFMGVGNLRVIALFRRAKRYVRKYDGAVIFIDEIDALGSRGSDVQNASSEGPPLGSGAREPDRSVIHRFMSPGGGMGAGIVNELLVQMDGLVMPKGLSRHVRRLLRLPPRIPSYNILIMGATNRASALDPALLRPGRFDRRIHVGLPDREGRIDVIKYYLEKVNHKPLDIGRFAQVTMGYAPARIKNLVNEALILALQDGRDALTWDDVWQAKLVDEIGLKQPVRYTHMEKVMTAVHEAGHAVAAVELRSRDYRIQVITIIKRQDSLGLVHSVELQERFSATKEELLTSIKVALAGMAAEEVWFGTSTSGPGSDLHQATLTALNYVGRWGMGKRLVSYGVIPASNDEHPYAFMLGQPELLAEVDALLQTCKAEVKELLQHRRAAVERIRDELLEKEELVGDRLDSLMNEIFPNPVAARTPAELPPATT